MVKLDLIRLTPAIAICILAGATIPEAAAAQAKPLPEVPAGLPTALRDSLETLRASLTAVTNEYLARGPAFNAQCGQVAADDTQKRASCQSQYNAMLGEAAVIKQKKSDFAARIASAIAAAALAVAAPAPSAIAAQNTDPTVVTTAAGGKNRTGAFGSNESNPDLKKDTDPNIVGPNTKAVDQLTSIARNAERVGSGSNEAASMRSREGFDTGLKQKGSLSDVKVGAPTGRAQMPVVPPAMANDKIIREGLDRYSKVLPALKEAQKAVDQAQVTSDNAKNPGAKAAALAALNAAKVKSEGLQVAAESAIKQVEQRTVYLGKLPVFKVPANDAKPPAKNAGVPTKHII